MRIQIPQGLWRNLCGENSGGKHHRIPFSPLTLGVSMYQYIWAYLSISYHKKSVWLRSKVTESVAHVTHVAGPCSSSISLVVFTLCHGCCILSQLYQNSCMMPFRLSFSPCALTSMLGRLLRTLGLCMWTPFRIMYHASSDFCCNSVSDLLEARVKSISCCVHRK